MATKDKAKTSFVPHFIMSYAYWLQENGGRVFIQLNLTDEEVTPSVLPHVQTPVKDCKTATFNITEGAVQGLVIGDEITSFSARFNGVAQTITFPTRQITAIYSPEIVGPVAIIDNVLRLVQAQNTFSNMATAPVSLNTLTDNLEKEVKEAEKKEKSTKVVNFKPKLSVVKTDK